MRTTTSTTAAATPRCRAPASRLSASHHGEAYVRPETTAPICNEADADTCRHARVGKAMDGRFVVYLLTNTANGKQYVGVTTQGLQQRWSLHKSSAAKGKRSRIALAIAKHGADAFTIEHVASAFDKPSMLATEIALIRQLGTTAWERGYNATAGGDSRAPTTDEWRARQSAAATGKTFSPEHRARMSVAIAAGMKASQNIKRTGRNRQLNLKVRAEDAAAFYALVAAEGIILGDAFAQAVAAWARDLERRKANGYLLAPGELPATS
jgi:group I intron endonuclease